MSDGQQVGVAHLLIKPKLDSSFKGEVEKSVPDGKDAGSKFGIGFGKAAAIAAGAALVAIGKAGFDAFAQVEEGANNVIKATGATGESAKALIGVYKNVASDVVGDFGDIGAAVGELNTRLGLNDKALQKASEQTMKFAKVNNVDAKKAVQDVTRLMNGAGISASEYDTVLGKLTVAAQQSGIDVSKLATSVTANAASFRQLGFSTDEAIAMLANFERAGVESSQVLAAMKRGIASWAKEGKDAKTGFSEFVAGVRNGTIDAAGAVELFGSRAGIAMYDAAKQGQLDFETMYKAIEGASSDSLDTVYNDTLTVSEKMGLAWQNVTLAMAEIFEPIVSALADFLTNYVVPAAKGLRDFATEIGKKLAPVVKAIQPVLEKLAEILGGVLGAAFGAVATVIGTLCDAVGWLWDNVLAPFGEWLGSVFGPIIEGIRDAFQGIVDFVTGALEFIAGAWDKIGGIIGDGMKASVQASANYGNMMLGVYTGNWTAIEKATGQTFTKNVPNTVKTGMATTTTQTQGQAKQITSIMQFPGMAQQTGAAFQSAAYNMKQPIDSATADIKSKPGQIVNAYSGMGGQMRKAVGDFKFPQPHVTLVPVDFLNTKVNLPKVEWYATGGVFDSPQVIGVGEAGREVVAPEPMLREIVREEAGADMTEVIGLLQALLAKDSNVYLDKRELVASTVGATDRALGNRHAMNRRGVANYA